MVQQDMEARYELTNGNLIEMPPESDENIIIARAMDRALSDLVGFRRVRTHQLALEMPGQPKNRFPNITVLLPEHLDQLKASGKSAIRLDMHPPMSVVEVVSPGADNHRRTTLTNVINMNGEAFQNIGLLTRFNNR